jgi:hypothetical protein
MRKRDRKELGRYIRAVADEMGLRDWTFNVVIGDPTADLPGVDYALASIECVDGRKYAVITFHEATRAEPPERLRDTCWDEGLVVHACEAS